MREPSLPGFWGRWSRRLADRSLLVALLAFVVSRAGIALVAYVSAPLVTDSAVPPYHIRPDNLLVDVFASRWDTGFYLSIAEEGYKYEGVRLPSVPFFPLLPLLMRILSYVVGDLLLAGLIISNLSLLVAAILLHKLTVEEFGPEVADRAVWYLLIFPTSLFGSAIYTESLLLAEAAGALLCARRGRWRLAALAGIAATLTRFAGLTIAPMLAAEWAMQRWRRPEPEKPRLAALLAPAAVPLGLAAYMLYLNVAFGDPLAFAHASEAWGRGPRSPLDTVAEMLQAPTEGWGTAMLAGRLPIDNWIDLISVLVFIVFGGILIHQRRFGEGTFVLLGALLPLSSGLLMSQRRYMWVLFPAQMLLARWGQRPWVDRMITSLWLLGLGVFTCLFANWYWVA